MHAAPIAIEIRKETLLSNLQLAALPTTARELRADVKDFLRTALEPARPTGGPGRGWVLMPRLFAWNVGNPKIRSRRALGRTARRLPQAQGRRLRQAPFDELRAGGFDRLSPNGWVFTLVDLEPTPIPPE